MTKHRSKVVATLAALVLGTLLLGWGLISLERIFVRERDDARAQQDAERAAAEGYGRELLEQALTHALANALPTLQAALTDPLLPSDALLVSFRGRPYLPRTVSPEPGKQTPVRKRFETLESALDATGDQPTDERLVALRAAVASLDSPSPNFGTALERLLKPARASSEPQPSRDELPFLLLVTERLQQGPATHPLVRALLQEGVPEAWGGNPRSGGLQRDLLRSRNKLTQDDFAFFLTRIDRLSDALGEPHDALDLRAQEWGTGALVIPTTLTGPTLIGARWYVEPFEDGVRGIRIEPRRLLDDVEQALRARRLLEAHGSLALASPAAVQPLESLKLQATLPAAIEAERTREQRFALKSALVTLCGLLALGIGVLALVAQERKARLLELKNDWVASVSHELRTPVAAIRLLAETLETQGASAPADYPRRIVESADRLHGVVENVLSFNRLARGRFELRPTEVALSELLTPLSRELAQWVDVPVRVALDVGNLHIHADPALMQLLFSNLGRNGCIYNQRRPVELAVSAHPKTLASPLVLFSDNGVGIPEREWDRIFEDFTRLKPPAIARPGSGLGLALCRRIMRLHGGDIRVALSSEAGTTFALSFPSLHHAA